ncbi:adenylate/guanylate cyclase domain-containing protein [Mycobacterium sp. UM_CSW]|uniref:ATP-binding protein n=1 Tax=Mycobacterium sp. UM_CSW TaxID=1370119 RepID=UPI001EF9EA59|nr:adenylate/guanylate cyclase domain-containing protein [Mycobacterium sp. UM_CSW]
MTDGRGIPAHGQSAQSELGASIDELVDRAVSAINRGDTKTATTLAAQVLAIDHGNADAEDLLSIAPGADGEIRRLTILFADVVDSTVLSTRVEPEVYRLVVGGYRDIVSRAVDRYGGHIGSTKGDGLLAVFGHPAAHENDVRRAVHAALEIAREVARLSEQIQRRFGFEIAARVGVHRGLVYLDTAQDDVYGLAANLAARLSGLAAPNSVVVSDPVAALVRSHFELEERPAAPVKGVAGLIAHHRVDSERVERPTDVHGPLVGRKRELARLHECWAQAQTGTLTTSGLFFSGEPGLGKSRLVGEATFLVKRSGGVVLELAGSPFHTHVGFHPVRSLLERRCGITRLTDAATRLRLLRDEISARGLDPPTTVPGLAPVLAIGPEHGYEPVQAEGRRLEQLITSTVGSYLRACLNDAPALLVAEDLQWFDPSTLEVVGAMLRGGDGRLLAVLTSRDEKSLPNDWQTEQFDLGPLTDEETDELIVALDPTLNDDQRASVQRRCDGVPFYIEQVVAGLRMTPSDDTQVPDALYEPLFARLRAGKNVVPVVEAAAVIGRVVDRSLLTTVSELDEETVDEVVDQLTDAGVFERTGHAHWRFRHELLREVADELAPPSVRRKLHAKVADALVHNMAGDPDWPLVASHYEQGGRHADAASAYQAATAAARRRGALAEARTYLTHVLTQVEQCPPGPDRDRREIAPRLERGYLTATAEGAQSRVAASDFERCLQLAGTDARDDDLLATLTAVGAYYLWRSDLCRVDSVLQAAVAATEHGRQGFRPALCGSTGIVAWLRGEFATASEHFDQAAAGLADDYEQRLQDMWFVPHDPVALAHEHLAWYRLIQGDLAGADVQLKRAVDRASRLGYPQRPYNHLYAIDMDVWVRAEIGQYDRARALVREMADTSERYGLDYLYWQLLTATENAMVDARADIAARRPDPAVLPSHVEALTQVIEVWQALGASTYRPFYWCVLGQLLTVAGQPDEARTRIGGALRFTADTGVRFYDAELLRARAQTHTDADARADDLAAARELARHQGAPLFEIRASLDDFDLRGEPARQHLIDAVAKIPKDSPLPELARAHAALH